jgi:ABC-type multidrug transport system fused ATPase/permease subunit
MEKNMLRAPLIKTAALLAVVSLLVYLTATSSEGSLWSSLGTLFMATLRIVQLSLGLIVSLFFCLAVLVGIVLACVAVVSRKSASNMVEQLRQQISDKLLYVRSLVIKDVPSHGAQVAEENNRSSKQELLATLEDSIAPIRQDHTSVAEKVEILMERLDSIEQSEEIPSLVNSLERQNEYVQGLDGKVVELQEQITALQETIHTLTSLSQDEKVDPAIGELGDRMSSLEKAIVSLQDDLSNAKETQGKSDSLPEKESVEHRLFTHLKNKATQETIEKLVIETLDKDMSYAQVIDHLVANTKGKTADIIAAHPSLAKDYIRYKRNKS